jgi:hypothetical protein
MKRTHLHALVLTDVDISQYPLLHFQWDSTVTSVALELFDGRQNNLVHKCQLVPITHLSYNEMRSSQGNRRDCYLMIVT